MAEYIEREAMMEDCKCMINEMWNSKTAPVSWSHAYAEFLDNVERAPAADVAPVVHGQWISWEDAGNFVPSPDRHECSVCHDAAQVLVNSLELLPNYCPNCGARMDGGDA